jgi:glycosyltransferase involved in cell wall biosynthesis
MVEETLPVRRKDPNTPFVSVITPTYNRRRFIPHLIKSYKEQSYKKDRMEWIILDDGQDKVKDLFEEAAKTLPNIRYYSADEKMTIGAKRNRLNDLSTGDIIIAMDDDDYYPPERVSHVVTRFKSSDPTIELAGSSEIYMFYSDNKTIYKLGPYNPNHATNGTMAWKATYAKSHRYDEFVTHAEERSFLEDYKHRMIQLDPFKVMLVMSHSENTFDKKKLREDPNPLIKKTDMKIKTFIKDAELRAFFSNA